MKVRNPDVVCANCPYFMSYDTGGPGQCRKRYQEGRFGFQGGYMYVSRPAKEFCTDHPEWRLLEEGGD